MNFEYILERHEIIDARTEHKYNEKKFKKRLFFEIYVSPLISILLLNIVFKKGFIFILLSYILLVLMLDISNKKSTKYLINKNETQDTQKFTLTVNDDFIIFINDNYTIELTLNSVLYFVETKEYLHIYTDSKEQIFVPKNVFESDEIKNAFLGKLQRS